MNESPISVTALDQMLSDERSQLLKASLPYLPRESQQILSIFTKTQELLHTVQLFSRPSPQMQMQSITEPVPPLEILKDVGSYCYGESRRKIEQAIQMFSVVQLMQTIDLSGDDAEENE